MAETLRYPRSEHTTRVNEWFSREPHPVPALWGARQSQLPLRPVVVQPSGSHGTSLLLSGRDSLVLMTNGESASSISVASISSNSERAPRNYVLVVDNADALQPAPIQQPPVYQCIFQFLRCTHRFRDRTVWEKHMTNHFGSVGPPPEGVLCCFCDVRCSWDELLQHLVHRHFILGHRIATARPNFELVNYMTTHGLITEQDWRDIQGTEESRPATEPLSHLATDPSGSPRPSGSSQPSDHRSPELRMHAPPSRRRERLHRGMQG